MAAEIGRPYRQVLSAALFDSEYLTAAETMVPRPYDEFLYDALAALTEAAHLTNQPMRQNSSGQWEPDRDPPRSATDRLGRVRHHALAGAAANIGGTEPVVIDLWVDSILRGINDTTYDDYRNAELELSRRQDAIPQPDDQPPAPLPRRPRIAAETGSGSTRTVTSKWRVKPAGRRFRGCRTARRPSPGGPDQ